MFVASGSMRLSTIFVVIIFFFAGTFFSCKKSSVSPPVIDESYFPLETGKYIVYDVDSVVYSNFSNSTDSFSFQIMEYIDSSYIDASHETAY